ncbi:metallophosphoesterase [Nostoc parmelioides]|uniref:Metallophosphoesterase n=1 Tax=Nostoc parmelioides FACHB-3921 TaxID=2692909 RepID=A0ABR8BKP7_9NOSO|nr:metallophosphoesterase [Nostoc parmelioides]MBD2254070.1 metallophosphoesterase [Nostoc parmelioides FACHB-3921]
MKFTKLLGVLAPFCLLGISATFISSSTAQPSFNGRGPKGFDFALIGDIPYDARQETETQKLIQDINNSWVRFVIHDGDFKSGSSPCSNELFLQRFQLLQQFRHPLVYVFGDNEWTDCHRPAAGGYDSLERLAKLREIFTQGDRSLGQRTIELNRQSDKSQYSKFRENVYWTEGDVLFTGIHVVGSNNNLGRNAVNDAEYAERNAANIVWLKEAFARAKAKRSLGVVIVIHGNPDDFNIPANAQQNGFRDFVNVLKSELKNYSKPVMLVHGDSHYFRIDKPLNIDEAPGTVITNFTRVETFGSPNVHWLRVTVNPRNPNLFEINQEIIPAK